MPIRSQHRSAVETRLGELVERLKAENRQLRADLKRSQWLEQRLEELQRRLGLNSRNSSKPPSSDGPAKPPAKPRQRSLRRRSGKRPGGQAGHKGTTLRQRADPDVVRNHVPGKCSGFGAPLSVSDSQGEPKRRQVFDLPEPAPLEVTEHRVHTCRRASWLQCAAALAEGRQRREAAAQLAIGSKSVLGQIWDRQAGLKDQGLPEGRTG